MTIAPEIRALLDRQKAAGLPAIWEAPLSMWRELSQNRIYDTGPIEPLYALENRFIPGVSADLPIRIYRPTDSSNTPVILFFHGGGWVMNFLDMYDAALSHLAIKTGATIISVAYQKAPEHPYPIPFDDCFATLQWVLKNAESIGVNPAKVGVAGDSAGGNLAAAVAIKARDLKIDLSFQLLIYPCIDRDFSTHSYNEFAKDYGLTTEAMKWFWEQYLQGALHDDDPYAVPGKSLDLKDCAPAIFIAAHYDPLLSDGKNYQGLLEVHGVQTVYREFNDMNHGFFINLNVTPTAREAIDFAARQITIFMQ